MSRQQMPKAAYELALKTKPVGSAKPKKSKTSAKKAIKQYCNTEEEYIDLLFRLKAHAEAESLPALRLLREVLSDLQKRELELLEYEKPKLSRTELTGDDKKPVAFTFSWQK